MANQQGIATKVWGHRGFSARYPENTLPAFQAALDVGVDGIEFDVHQTRDGEVVVLHDETVNRTTNGTGRVADMTFAELTKLDAGGWFHPSFQGTRIPHLMEVLGLIAQHNRRIDINIELKSSAVMVPGFEEKVLRMVHNAGLQSNAIYSSFNHYSLRHLKHIHPEADIGILYMEGLVEPWRYAKFLGATALHPYEAAFDENIVQEAHQVGVRIHAFTVNQEETMVRFMDWGVDAVITDVPDQLLTIRARKTAKENSRPHRV